MDIILVIVSFSVGVALGSLVLWRVVKREQTVAQMRIEDMQQSHFQSNDALQRAFKSQIDMLQNSEYTLRIERDKLSTELASQKNLADSQKEILFGQIAQIEKERGELTAKVESLESAEKKIKENFEDIALRVLQQKSDSFSAMNKEGLSVILSPLAKDIESFKRQIEALHLDQARQTTSLSTELRQLMELNRRLSDDATDLTRALKGEHNPKMQGDWGEMILDSLLSGSGLKEGEHYFLQTSDTNEDGRRLRPDVVVRYPDGREIIIDSKVSLTAYTRYVEADTSDDREVALKDHVVSVRRHIDSLCSKEYYKRDASCDFVMMFMPVEPAYMVALGADNSLWDYAYKKKIVLVSPTHLITALKLVYDLWSRYDQSQNALKIASRGAELYDKFAGFVADMTQIGKAIDNTRKQYDGAMNKLSSGKGNLLRQAEMLRELGVRSSKNITLEPKNELEIDEQS